MAERDGKTIKIHVETTANTRGIDQADDAVVKLNGTVNASTMEDFLERTANKARVTEFAFYDLDQEITRTGNSSEKLQPLVGSIQRVENAARKAGPAVGNLGGFMTQAGYQVTDFAVQIQGGTSAITAFSQQFPQLAASAAQSGLSVKGSIASVLASSVSMGTAISVAAVAIGIGLQQTVKAYDDMSRSVDNADKATKRFQESMTTAEERRVGLAKSFRDDIEKQLEDDARAAKLFSDELERADRIAKGKQDLAIAQAKAGGATDAQIASMELENAAAQRGRELEAARQREAELQKQLNAATAAMNNFPAGSSAEELEAATRKVTELKDSLTVASREVATLVEEGQLAIRQQGVEAVSSLTKDFSEQQTKNATDIGNALREQAEAAKQTLEQAVAAQGDKASVDSKAAIDKLAGLLKDGQITPEEVDRMRNAIEQGRVSQLALNSETSKALGAMAANTDELKGMMVYFFDIAQRQSTELQSLRQLVTTLSSRIK